MSQALLTFTRNLVAASRLGTTEVSARSGVSLPTVRRILGKSCFREIDTLERTFVASGLGLMGRDAGGMYHVIFSNQARVPVGLPESAITESTITASTGAGSTVTAPGGDGLLGVLAGHCRSSGLNPHRISLLADIPYASAHRLLGGQPSRVVTTIQRLLTILEATLIAVAADGTCSLVPAMSVDPARGAAQRQANAEAQRRYRMVHPLRCREAHAAGRLLIGKGEVLDLYRRHRLSYAEIGRLAGVSRHRVRQIVTMMAGDHREAVSR